MLSLSPNLQKLNVIWRFVQEFSRIPTMGQALLNNLTCVSFTGRQLSWNIHRDIAICSPGSQLRWRMVGARLSGAARSHLRWGQEWAETRAKCEVVSRDALAHCAESSAEETTFKVVPSWGKRPGLYTPGATTGYGLSWEGSVTLHHVTLFSCDSLSSGNQLKPASWSLPALGVISIYSWRVILAAYHNFCHSAPFILLRSTSTYVSGRSSFRMPVGLFSWGILRRRLMGPKAPIATNELFSPCSTIHSKFSLHLASIPFGLCGFPGGVIQALIPRGLSFFIIRPF